ncbi:MAG: hypothetical protein LM565_06810 [Thermofilum sp.]|nr:hypothetical protein [Thermofilum sp.]
MKRIEAKNKRFLTLLEHMLTAEKLATSELAQLLNQKLNLAPNTAKAYSSQLLADLAAEGILERKGRSYTLTPKGWALLFTFIDRTPFSEKYFDMFFERLTRNLPAASTYKEIVKTLRRIYFKIAGEPEKLPAEMDLLELFGLFLKLSGAPAREITTWEDALSVAVPDLGALRDRNIFYSMLREELRQADELTRSAAKDLLSRLADSLRSETRSLEREMERRRSVANELEELAKQL